MKKLHVLCRNRSNDNNDNRGSLANLTLLAELCYYSNTARCQQCSEEVSLDSIYILDECTHRFCKNCLQQYVAQEIARNVAIQCPKKDCKSLMSVRDMGDLLPTIKKQHKFVLFSPPFLNNWNKQRLESDQGKWKGDGAYYGRIEAYYEIRSRKECNNNYQLICLPLSQGYSVNPLGDNLYKW